MRRTRLTKKLDGFWARRIKKVKPMWEVRYEVYERVKGHFKATGEFAEIRVMADDPKGAEMETRRQLAPIYKTYHYGFKIKKVKKV